MFAGTRVFNEFNDLFRDFGLPVVSGRAVPAKRATSFSGRYPAVESFSKDGKLVLRAELPGVKSAEVEITVEDGRLTLKGEKKAESEHQDESFHVREFSYGRFERSFVLPEDVDAEAVKARMDDGVLEVSVPYVEKPAARRIAIEGETENAA